MNDMEYEPHTQPHERRGCAGRNGRWEASAEWDILYGAEQRSEAHRRSSSGNDGNALYPWRDDMKYQEILQFGKKNGDKLR